METDKQVLYSVANQAISNILFFGIGALVAVFLNWNPLLWVGVAVYGIFGAFNLFRGAAGLVGDIASFFTADKHAHLSQFAATIIILLEAIIFLGIAYYFYTLI